MRIQIGFVADTYKKEDFDTIASIASDYLEVPAEVYNEGTYRVLRFRVNSIAKAEDIFELFFSNIGSELRAFLNSKGISVVSFDSNLEDSEEYLK